MKVEAADAPKLVQNGVLHLSGKQLLLLAWTVLGVFPFILQVRSFVHFVTPHKISQHLVVPTDAVREMTDLQTRCPAKEMYVANVYWNVAATHYYSVDDGRLCHFVIPQYNVHGTYFLGKQHSAPSPNTQVECANDSFPVDYYFYHGSFGYYAFYEEGVGSYCEKDLRNYVLMTGLGTYDINGIALTKDQGSTAYRHSYWYGAIGAAWIAIRACMLRRSFILCRRHATRCVHMQHRLRLVDAMVYVQETMRLSAHNATNLQRSILLYLLVEGVMSELFMLIALEGTLGRLQYISLGYNLSGIMSMLFEMIEATKCLPERTRCFFKRLLFNHETVLIGELICAGAMQYYMTALNRTSLKDFRPRAGEASYYVWSLVGHSAIVSGCVIVLVSVRTLTAVAFVRYRFGSFAVLTAPCCVDTTMGVRCKLIMLGGYTYDNGKLYYRPSTLATFGILRSVEEDGSEYIAFYKLNWAATPKRDLVVIGKIYCLRVKPCKERPCGGIVSTFGTLLGGRIDDLERRRFAIKKLVQARSTCLLYARMTILLMINECKILENECEFYHH